ncbi:MAG: outer membrane protein, partial [Rhizobiaceae bacterium]
FGGAQIGSNWQFAQFVAGLEVDLGYLGADDSLFGFQNGAAIARAINDTGMEVDDGWYGVLAGRHGSAMDRTSTFANGGLAIADVDGRSGELDGAQMSAADFDISDTTNTSGSETGYAIGGGIEYAMDGG